MLPTANCSATSVTNQIICHWLLLLHVSLQFAGEETCAQSITCGTNAVCEYTESGAKCSCLPSHHGDPLVECQKHDCDMDSDCTYPLRCQGHHCTDVCRGMCGHRSLCKVKPGTSIPVCYCPQGYTGNPLVQCRKLGPQELCQTSKPCGKNTNCRVGKNRATAICSCKKGYKGNPLTGCEPECYTNHDCKEYQACKGTSCVDVCNPNPCGKDANCIQKDHKAECKCYYNRIGDPWKGCEPECKKSNECPFDRPVCFYDRCINPCLKKDGESVCGKNADCSIKNDIAVCSCFKGHTGNPLKACRPIEAHEVCTMIQCGKNAICTPKLRSDGEFTAVCSCPRLHKGNALKHCKPVECDNHDDCSIHLICRKWKCQNPCPNSCGSGAKCHVNSRRVIVCSCPIGTIGNPLKSCRPVEG